MTYWSRWSTSARGEGILLNSGLLGAAAAAFLFEDRLAEVDTLAADVNVARSFDQRPDVAIALSAERAERVFLGGAASPAARSKFSSRLHVERSFRPRLPSQWLLPVVSVLRYTGRICFHSRDGLKWQESLSRAHECCTSNRTQYKLSLATRRAYEDPDQGPRRHVGSIGASRSGRQARVAVVPST